LDGGRVADAGVDVDKDTLSSGVITGERELFNLDTRETMEGWRERGGG